jgi:phospholipid/cholesterol/gamma-HCH transport system permease protein
MLLKNIFAMLLATIPSFHGYYMKGGALEGRASTVSLFGPL